MKKITTLNFLALVFCALTFTTANAQYTGWQWAKGTGLGSNDNAGCVATDDNGNAYVTGAITIVTEDIFITKTNAAGTTKWTKLINGGGLERGRKIAVDKKGNVYVAGTFESPYIVFGTDTLHHLFAKDIFLVKYDSTGNVLWARTPVGTANTDEDASGLCIDTAGDVLLAGAFQYDILSFGTHTLTTNGAYVAKYDANGNAIWAKGLGAGIATGVSADGANNIFITGMYGEASMNFGGIVLNNSDPWGGSWDVFVYKMNAGGTPQWGRTAGSFQAYEQGQGIAADSAGNVYVTGAYQSPGISFGTYSLNNNGAQEYFIVKYDAGGTVLWAQSAGGNNWDSGWGVATDRAGNAYVTGPFSTNITFGNFTLNNVQPGTYDIFIVKYDPSGYVLWAKSAGGTNSDMSTTIAVSRGKDVYIGGGFVSSSLAFGTTTLNNNGASDLFFAKYTPCSDNNYVPICMVTVDSMSQNNIIYWDKTALTHSVDSFIVYREIQTNLYLPIGAVPFDSLSLFVDTVRTKYFANYFNTGDPNSGTYRYKIAIRDTCGNVSEMSAYHNTIYMINNNGTFSWPQLYNIENASNPVGSYVLYRDNFNTGNWQGVNSVTGSQQTITDPSYQAYQSTANWQIRTLWSIACTPTQRLINPNEVEGAVVKSKSNITNNRVAGIQNGAAKVIRMHPNPSTGAVTLQAGVELGSVVVVNSLGETIYQSVSKEKTLQLDLSNQPAGIYFVRVQGQYLKVVRE